MYGAERFHSSSKPPHGCGPALQLAKATRMAATVAAAPTGGINRGGHRSPRARSDSMSQEMYINKHVLRNTCSAQSATDVQRNTCSAPQLEHAHPHQSYVAPRNEAVCMKLGNCKVACQMQFNNCQSVARCHMHRWNLAIATIVLFLSTDDGVSKWHKSHIGKNEGVEVRVRPGGLLVFAVRAAEAKRCGHRM